MADAARLQRLLRVRTLQLGLARVDENTAAAALAREQALGARIAQLADDVAPRAGTSDGAASLAAAATYRARLHASAEAAATRIATARVTAQRAAAATGQARRDQSAIEKLLERAAAETALREVRAMEEGAAGARKRHAPC